MRPCAPWCLLNKAQRATQAVIIAVKLWPARAVSRSQLEAHWPEIHVMLSAVEHNRKQIKMLLLIKYIETVLYG